MKTIASSDWHLPFSNSTVWKEFNCHECGKTFSSFYSLAAHIGAAHRDSNASKRRNLDATELQALYYNQQLSQAEIAKRLHVSQNHISSQMKEYTIATRSLTEAQRVAVISGRKKINQPNLTPSEALVYVIGVLKGDGSVYLHKNGQGIAYEIGLGQTKREFAYSFQSALESLGLKARVDFRRKRNGTRLIPYFRTTATSKIFYQWYKGLTIEEIRELLIANSVFIDAFLRGFYESEGCVSVHKNRVPELSIVNANASLADLSYELIRILGFNAKIHRYGSMSYIRLYGKEQVSNFLHRIKPCIKNNEDYSLQ